MSQMKGSGDVLGDVYVSYQGEVELMHDSHIQTNIRQRSRRSVTVARLSLLLSTMFSA